MINLCNTNKYSLDPDGSIPSKRVPRPIEDIEIIGVIKNDETINMVNAGSCGLSGIGSITTTFDKQDRILTIQGSSKGVFTAEGDNNPRHPTGEALSGIMANNPLRATHGWYTIDPTYSIGYLSSNSQIKIDNIGLNNKELNAYNTKVNNATYADGVISTNNLQIINSYFYNTDITCSGIDINNNTKIDGISTNAENIKLTNSSIADSTLQAISFDCSNTPLIDCSIFCESGTVRNCNIKSVISQESSNNKLLSISNSDILAGSSISADTLRLQNSVTINGDIISQTLESQNQDNMILANGTINTTHFLGSISNSGVLSLSSVSGLSKPDITNYGRLTVSASGALKLTNDGFCLVDNNASFVSSLNKQKGIIEGSFNFENSINSGSIRGNNISFAQSINYGSGSEIYFYSSYNYGLVNKGYYLCGSLNYGFGGAAEFYCNSQNMGQPTTCLFFDQSQNNGTISSGIFKNESINNVAGTGHLFYDKSTNIGPLWEASFYNSGMSSNASLINTNFYDTSRIDKATIPSGFVNCYGSTSGIKTITINSGIVSMYDTSYAKEIMMTSYSGSLQLYDNSWVETIEGPGNIKLYNNSKVKNLDAMGTLHDSSICLNSKGLITLRDQSSAGNGVHTMIDAYDNAKVSGAVTKVRLSDNSQFFSKSFIQGLIMGNAKLVYAVVSQSALFVDGASTPSGQSYIDSVGFFGGSTCKKNTQLFTNNVSLYDSNNEGKITANIVSYCENSNNSGTGISSLTRFGSGSINYGTIFGTAHFYMGSQNLGIVTNGSYHPSIQETGINTVQAEFDSSLEKLICGPPSFSFLAP
jgi:hypothetical protein